MSIGLLLAYLAILIGAVLSVAAPLMAGRWLADRELALEAEETEAVEARALAMLGGLDPRHCAHSIPPALSRKPRAG